MDIEIKGGLSMNHETKQSDWRTEIGRAHV